MSELVNEARSRGRFSAAGDMRTIAGRPRRGDHFQLNRWHYGICEGRGLHMRAVRTYVADVKGADFALVGQSTYSRWFQCWILIQGDSRSTGLVSVPIRSISMLTLSPGFSQRGCGVAAMPTP